MNKIFLLFLSLSLACGLATRDRSSDSSHEMRDGDWHFSLNLGESTLPFNAVFSKNQGENIMVVRNAQEEIIIRKFVIQEDSISMTLPVFGSELKGKLTSDTVFEGFWYNVSRGADYKIPFMARYGKPSRFELPVVIDNASFEGKWEVTFNPNMEENCKAIGLFQQDGNKVIGTFLTEMGDYRFLEGEVSGNKMMLSSFDGSHAFLFSAELNSAGEIEGSFWSGIHWKEQWSAKRNDDFQLTHPDSLTLITEKAPPFSFSFPDMQGKTVSFTDNQFRDKVVIVQLMGSWCPNCADESYVFSEFYRKFHHEGLEIVAIAYERFDALEDARKYLERFKEDTGAEYPFLYAGKVSKEKASKDFPMINAITSFPTAFFIDRKNKIRKIHTGFYGPGTGRYYQDFKEDLELFVEKLLREKVSS